MPVIRTRDELKAYARRKLTHSQIRVEMDEEQFDDAIDDAIQRFRDRSYSGSEEKYYVLDVLAGKKDYQMPASFASILEVKDATNLFPSMFSNEYIIMTSYMQNAGGGSSGLGLLDIELMRGHLQNMEYLLKVDITYTFSPITKMLKMHSAPEVAKKVLLKIYEYVPEEDNEEGNTIYNQTWIKKYAAALARLQWADNAIKYNGSILPNGLTFNADGILNRANEDILKLDEQLENEYTEPVDFYVG